MSIKQFKFVSPGVFVNEIDQSQVPREPEDIGPVIIGHAEKGPNLIPVTCRSYEEFFQIFGESSPGLGNSDAWRNGSDATPTYGSYAAQAYFRNGGPVTFVKLAGIGGSTVGQEAGWSVAKTWGVFVGDTGSARKMLAAVFYTTDSGATFSITDTAGKLVVTISPTTGSDIVHEISFDRTSQNFIRKVFNTDPTLTNTSITATSEQQVYWLGQTFESSVLKHCGANPTFDAIVSELYSYADWKKDHVEPSTGWIVSQAPTESSADYDTSDVTDFANFEALRLFKFHSLRGGEWDQKNVKISIQDIKAPTNEFTEFGTFSVIVRKADDTDARPKILERFTNVNLDKNSDNFIAKVIGDRYYEWSEENGEKKYKRYGNFDNVSNYIRVEMKTENNSFYSSKYPFGFEGPQKFKPNDDIDGGTEDVQFPTYLLRESTDIFGENLSDDSQAYFGVTNYQHNGSAFVVKHSQDYGEHSYLTAGNPSGSAADDSEAAGPAISFVFTLDDIVVGDTSSTWTPGAFAAGGTDTYTNLSGSEAILDKHNRFTMPLHGGFDGLDVTEKNPFGNHAIDASAKNYEFLSVERALNTVADPEVVEMNLLAVPGLNKPSLTGKMMDVCENRGDALAIIDIENDYIPSTESTSAESDRLPSPSQAVSSLKARGVNSSYGACFFPWVTIRDEAKNKSVDVPPSVAMMGVMASSTARSELWFAPAGFTRGGLSANGAAGLPVVDVKYQLSSKERDSLYENSINPIASFPNEGIVVFGQKTLQVTQSALDRINVRRLMIYVKKEISRMAATLLFEPNVNATWSRFLASADPFLRSVQSRFGLTEYKVILDETTTTPELVDRNIMYAKIFLKPARAIEFIALDFTITNTGASFEDL